LYKKNICTKKKYQATKAVGLSHGDALWKLLCTWQTTNNNADVRVVGFKWVQSLSQRCSGMQHRKKEEGAMCAETDVFGRGERA
jgi:hypothetical protein